VDLEGPEQAGSWTVIHCAIVDDNGPIHPEPYSSEEGLYLWDRSQIVLVLAFPVEVGHRKRDGPWNVASLILKQRSGIDNQGIGARLVLGQPAGFNDDAR
jgi:hypothetical protein